jgi:hypothetical protein
MFAAIWFLIGTLIVLTLTALLYAVIQLKDRQNEYDRQASYVAKQVATVDALTKSRLAKTDEKTMSTQQQLSDANKTLSTKIGSLDDRAMGLAEGTKTRLETNVQQMQRQVRETEQKTTNQVQQAEKKLQDLEKKTITDTQNVRTELITAIDARSKTVQEGNVANVLELSKVVNEGMIKLQLSIQDEIKSVRDSLKAQEVAILENARKSSTELQVLHQNTKNDIASLDSSLRGKMKTDFDTLDAAAAKRIASVDTALRTKMKTDIDSLDAAAAKRIAELKVYTDGALKTLDNVTQTRIKQVDVRLTKDLNAYREAVAKDMARMVTKTDLADMQRKFGDGFVTKLLTTSLLDLGNDDKDRDANAGKIAYRRWGDKDALDVVGAGKASQSRKVRVWDQLSTDIITTGETRTPVLDLGIQDRSRAVNTGKIMYRGMGAKDSLDVVGVGKSGEARKVRVWDQLATDQVSANVIYSKDSHADVLDLGFEDKGRDTNAGKITYRKWDKNALEIVGAGKSGQSRRVRVWDELNTDSVHAKDVHLKGKLCIDDVCIDSRDISRILKNSDTSTLTTPPTTAPPAVSTPPVQTKTQVSPMPPSAFPLTAPTTNTQVQAPVVVAKS